MRPGKALRAVRPRRRRRSGHDPPGHHVTPHPLALLAICVAAAVTALTLAGSRAAVGSRDVASPPLSSGAYDDHLAPPSACPDSDTATLAHARQHAAMLCLIDYARAARGVRRLARSPRLLASASIKAGDVVRCSDFSHTACGRPAGASYGRAGYGTARAAPDVSENLAYGSGPFASPRSIMRAWLGSDAHRENLLDERWLEQGVAMRRPAAFLGVRGNAVWVSHFGRPERG